MSKFKVGDTVVHADGDRKGESAYIADIRGGNYVCGWTYFGRYESTDDYPIKQMDDLYCLLGDQADPEDMWAPPTGEPVVVPLSTYRVLVRMVEHRDVWVEADNPIEAVRIVEEEDWFGPEFVGESQTLDCEFGSIVSLEQLS